MPKLDPASELIRESLINYNPTLKAEYSAMNKIQLRDALLDIVNYEIASNESLANFEGRKPSRDELVKYTIKVVCNQLLHISTRTYNEFMNSF